MGSKLFQTKDDIRGIINETYKIGYAKYDYQVALCDLESGATDAVC